MKHLPLLLSGIVGVFAVASAGEAHADEHHHPWWWHPHPAIIVEPAPVYVESAPVYYRGHHSVAVDVQLALRHRGYYRGPIDGDIGPGSRAAIRAYQYDHGLRPTGDITDSLLRSLRI